MALIFEKLFSFVSPLHVFLFIDFLLVIAILVVLIVKYCLKLRNAEDEVAAPVEEAVSEPVVEPVVEVVKEEPAPVVKEEPVVEAKPEPVKEEVASEPVDEMVIGDIDDVESAKRIPFKDKILGSAENVQGYYNAIENAFNSYRKINSRVSIKGVSYRLGRQLVAKLTIRGKTLKFHLALDVNKFDQKVFFQKDMSDVKEYVEVPFTVKVRSDRALKNALKLVESLAEAHGIEKKTRFTEVDAIAELKAKD
ncbi:MAG: hypothetical protein E7369_03345 [Clostridiales bacterium]|nr:hypothetical protein [Clostridiales bacterium]